MQLSDQASKRGTGTSDAGNAKMNAKLFDIIVDLLNAAAQDNEDDGDREYGKNLEATIEAFELEVERENIFDPQNGWTKRKPFDGGIADRAKNVEWVQKVRDWK